MEDQVCVACEIAGDVDAPTAREASQTTVRPGVDLALARTRGTLVTVRDV